MAQVTQLGGSSRHDEILGLTGAGDREVGFDAAAGIEPLRVDDLADGNVDLIVAGPLQQGAGVAAGDEELGEARLVEQADALAHRHVLLARGIEPVLAAVGIGVFGRLARQREPVRPLPAGDLAKAGAGCGESIVQAGAPHAPRRAVLVVGPVHGVEQAQRLGDAWHQEMAAVLVGIEPADVDFRQVERRLALHDPVGERHAGPPAGLDADGVEAGRHEEVLQRRRGTEDVALVGGVALRPVEERADADPLQASSLK